MQTNRKPASIESNIKGKLVEEAQRFTVDSVIGDYLRILVAKLAKPVQTPHMSALVPFDIWEKENEKILKPNEAATMIGIEPASLLEGRVFVRTRGQTFDITELVRTKSKKTYAPLVSREFRRRGPKNW